MYNFALIIRSHYYTQSEAVIWILAGGSPILSFWMVLDTLVAARGRRRQQVGMMSTSDSQLKDCT